MGRNLDPLHYLSRSLELDPCHIEAACLRSKLLIDSGKAELAIEFLKSFLTKSNQHSQPHNFLALAYLNSGQVDAADIAISEALAINPRSMDALYTASQIRKAKGDKFSAYYYLERIMRNGEHSSEILWEMSSLIDDKTERKKKINLLEIALSLNSNDAKIFGELMITYSKLFDESLPPNELSNIQKTLIEHTNNLCFQNLPDNLKLKIYNFSKLKHPM
jgi:tetratricopeptide (TPR) repeat protein